MEPTKNSYPSARERIRKEKALFLEYLKKTPLIEFVCQKVGIARSTIYRWKREDPKFEKAFDEAIYIGTDVTNDAVESALLQGVQKGNPALIKFYLQRCHPKYSTPASLYLEKLRKKNDGKKKVEEPKEQPITPERKAYLEKMLKDVTDFQAQFKNEGLVIHDPPPPEVPMTHPEEPTAS